MNRITWCVLLAVAATAPTGCGHESVAGTSQPSPAAIVAAPVAPRDAANSADAASAESSPATEAPARASTELSGRQPPKDASQTRAPADRTPTRPGDAEKITFDDLNLGMQADMVFRPFLITERVKELEGKRIRIAGFMGAVESRTKIKQFILLKNTECKYGAGGQADHLAEIHMLAGETTKFQIEALKVEGVFKVEPFQGTDGNTWSIYRLDDAKIVK